MKEQIFHLNMKLSFINKFKMKKISLNYRKIDQNMYISLNLLKICRKDLIM